MLTPEKIEWVNVNSLKPHPKNPNKHSDDQIERLAKIIKYQGFRIPITVVGDSNVMAAGHGRLLAAKKARLTKVPIIRQEFIDDEQLYAFIVSDNAIAAWADLDFSQINKDLDQLTNIDLDFLAIKNFEFNSNIEQINKGDENSAWVGSPEFEKGENYIRLTYIFNSDEERASFVLKNKIEVKTKLAQTWLVYP